MRFDAAKVRTILRTSPTTMSVSIWLGQELQFAGFNFGKIQNVVDQLQ